MSKRYHVTCQAKACSYGSISWDGPTVPTKEEMKVLLEDPTKVEYWDDCDFEDDWGDFDVIAIEDITDE